MKFFKKHKKDTPIGASPENINGTELTRNKYAAKEKIRKKRPLWMKILIAVIILALVGTGIFLLINYFLNRGGNGDELSTATSYRGSLSTNISGWGTASPKQKIDISSTSIGKVTDVRVATGDSVNQGDVLFVVDPSSAKDKLSDAQKRYDAAAKQVAEVEKSIKELELFAPFAGKLVDLPDLTGLTSISAGTELGRLINDSQMKLKLLFNYSYVDEIKPGMSATVSIPSGMTSLSGTVLSVSRGEINGEEGGIYFEAYISIDNPKALVEGTAASAVIHGNNKDYYPYNGGSLEYLQSEKLSAKQSGDIKYSALADGYRCEYGEKLLALTSDSLINSLDSAKRELSDAKEAVDELRETIAAAVCTSPISGIVTTVAVNVGDELTNTGGTTLVSISNLNEMIVKSEIDEANIDKVKVGTPVDINVYQTEKELSLEGVVQNVSFEASAANGGNVATFPIEIAISKNSAIMPGMGVSYSINLVMRDDCIIVPTEAIEYTEEGAAVFVRKETASQYEHIIDIPAETAPEGFCAVPVTIGISDVNGTEIISGIAEDVEVYVRSAKRPDYSYGGGMISFG